MAENYNDTIAAINAANQALGNVAVVSGNRAQQKRAFKYQKQAMEMQNEMWKENTQWLTEYNSPANQLARYREAGINPNFVFGQVNAGASSGEKPTATAPDITGKQKVFMQALSNIRDIVPMFQAAVKAQQDLKRGEVATAMDYQRLKSMEIENKYQDEFLSTRNAAAALEYLWKQGTSEDRSEIIRYQKELARQRLDDAIDAFREHSEDREYWLTTGRDLDERYKRGQIAGMSKRYQLMSREIEMLEKYGVKSIGDMSFGGLLLNTLDASGALPMLINWLNGKIGNAAHGADSDQPPFSGSRKHEDGSTTYHRTGNSRFLFGPTADDYKDMFPMP